MMPADTTNIPENDRRHRKAMTIFAETLRARLIAKHPHIVAHLTNKQKEA